MRRRMSAKFAWKQYYLVKEDNERLIEQHQILLEKYERKCEELEFYKGSSQPKKQEENHTESTSDKKKIERLEKVIAELTKDEEGDTSVLKKLKRALHHMVGM